MQIFRATMILIAISTLVILISDDASSQQYGWSVIATPRPGWGIWNVEFKDSLHGWTSAGYDSIYRTADGGLTWRTGIPAEMFRGFIDISFFDTLYGWAVGGISGPEAVIWKTTDGGLSWGEQLFHYDRHFSFTSAQSQSMNTTVGSTYGTYPDTGKITRTFNGGMNWTERTLADSITGFRRIQFIDSLHGWVLAEATSRFVLLRTTDGGGAWLPDSSERGITGFTFIDTLEGFARCGKDDLGFYFCRTVDGGQSWTDNYVVFPGIGSTVFEAMSFIDNMNGWMFGSTFYQGGIRELILRTTDAGYSWSQESIGLTGDLTDGIMIDRYHGWAVSLDGKVLAYGPATEVVERLDGSPESFALHQNYPNPFNGSTSVVYEVPIRTPVRIDLFDVVGRRIATPVDAPHGPGKYRFTLDGSSLGSGVYYLRLEADSFQDTKQLLLIR
jgi:photosystem II stability/assembly factor-like uncharacterized protein